MVMLSPLMVKLTTTLLPDAGVGLTLMVRTRVPPSNIGSAGAVTLAVRASGVIVTVDCLKLGSPGLVGSGGSP